MNPDAASLANLHDIALPPPVAWWPPPVGWWILAGGVLACALLGCADTLHAWRANAYRRAALAELRTLERAPALPASMLAALLKRTALVAYPRVQVARLTGTEWLRFLDETAGRRGFVGGPGAALARATLDDRYPLAADEARALVALARRWIRRHRRDGHQA